MKASQTVYLTRDRSRAVPAGDKEAAILLCRAGQEVPQREAERYPNAVELIGGTKAQPIAEESSPETTIETREPEPQHRDPKHKRR